MNKQILPIYQDGFTLKSFKYKFFINVYNGDDFVQICQSNGVGTHHRTLFFDQSQNKTEAYFLGAFSETFCKDVASFAAMLQDFAFRVYGSMFKQARVDMSHESQAILTSNIIVGCKKMLCTRFGLPFGDEGEDSSDSEAEIPEMYSTK